MIDKPQWRPSEGCTYLKDVPVGELVDTQSGLRAIVVDQSPSSTSVIVLKAHNEVQDKSFYLGEHRWGMKTEVKIIGD